VVQNDAGMLTKFRLDEYVTFLKARGYTANGFATDFTAVN
jgi:hypothetical protein